MTEKNKTPGQILRAAREAKAMSPADIAKEMRLSTQAVDDIERDEYGNLGVRTFARGYIAIYARVVGISQTAVLELFDAISPMPEIVPASASVVEGAPVMNVTRERSAFRYSPKVLIGAACVVFILFALVFHSEKSPTDAKKDGVKAITSSVAPSIVIPAESTAAVPVEALQKTAVVEAPKAMTPKAAVVGQINPGTNTPFIRKPAGHAVASVKPKYSVHPSSYTVTPISPEEKTS